MLRMIRMIATIPILLYRWLISPLFPSHCNYYPTCSEYGRQAIMKHGILRGGVMAIMRIGRCSARYYGGTDPVPDRFVFSDLLSEYPSRSVRRHRATQEDQMNDTALIALSQIPTGTQVTVARLDGGEGFRDKVISLGVIPGKTLTVQSYSKKGPLVVQMEGSRIAIGRELAKRILVQYQ
ncbi:MAG: membrane protein insertion efficiency factor YidD [Alkalispirochaeta sp.]